MESDKFWLVVEDKLISSTDYVRKTKEDAFALANRAITKENNKFFIMECIGFCEGSPVQTTMLDDLHDVSSETDIYNRAYADAYADIINNMSVKNLQVRRNNEHEA